MNRSTESAPRPIGEARGHFDVLVRLAALGLAALSLTACADRTPAGPDEPIPPPADAMSGTPAAQVRALAARHGITPMPSPRDPTILPTRFDAVFTRQVTAYMQALTDDRARNLDRLIPRNAPSGLAVDR